MKMRREHIVPLAPRVVALLRELRALPGSEASSFLFPSPAREGCMSYNTMLYRVTMDDPEVFTKPWNAEETFRLRPGERIREYECIENNEDLLRIERLLKDESVFKRPATNN